MGALQQLGLILWKNIILRKRHPGIFFLEIIWPILIFVTVALVRLAAPPKEVHQCHYAPRAMPSAGGFQFLQSFACNLDNQCFPDEESAMKTKENPRMAEFLTSTAPFTSDMDKTNKLLRDLPDAIKVLNNLQKALNSPDIKDILDVNLTLGDFVKDRNAVRYKLVTDMAVLPGDVVDSILDSSLNVTQLYQLSGHIDFKAVVCDPKELAQYLFIRGNVTAEQMSRQLCAIDNDLIPDITAVIQQQLDVAAIVKLIARLKRVMGDYTDAMMLEDIVTLLQLLDNSTLVRQFLTINKVINIQSSAKWILDLVQYVQKLISSDGSSFNIASLQAIFLGLDPMISSLTPDASWYQNIKKVTAQIYRALDMFKESSWMINNPEATLYSILGDNSELIYWFKNVQNISVESMNKLLSIPIDLTKVSEFVAAVSDDRSDPLEVACNKPGFISIYDTSKVDAETKQLLRDQKDAICSMNMTNFNFDFTEMFDFTKIREIRDHEIDDILKNFNWTELYEMGKNMFVNLKQISGKLEPLMRLGKLDFQHIWNSLSQSISSMNMMNGTMSSGDMESLLHSYNWMSSMSFGSMDNRTALVFYSYLLDMMYSSTQNYKEFPAVFTEVLKENFALRQFVGQMLRNDDKFVTALLPMLIRSDAIKLILNNPQEFLSKIACNRTYLEEFFNQLPGSEVNVTTVQDMLCDRNLTDALQMITKKLDVEEVEYSVQQIQGILNGGVNVSSSVYDDRANTMALYNRTMALWVLMMKSDKQPSHDDWSEIADILRMEGVETDWASWTLFMRSLETSAQATLGHELLITLGPALEGSRIFPQLQTLVRLGITCGNYEGSVIKFTKDTMAQKTEIGRFSGAQMEALPDMIDVVTLALQNKTFAKELTRFGTHFCDNSMDHLINPIMLRPSVATLRSWICQKGWLTRITEEFTNITNSFTKCQESAMDLFHAPDEPTGAINITIKAPPPIDWEQAYQVFYGLYMDMTSTDWTGISINTTRLDEAIGNITDVWNSNLLADSMNGLGYAQLAGFEVMQQFLPMDNSVLNTMNYYGHAVNDMMKTCMEMMQNYNGKGLNLVDFTGNSTQLYNLLEKQMAVIPDLMKAVQSAMLQPNKLMHMLMTSDLTQKTICKDLKLSDIMSFEDDTRIQEYEDALCSLDMNAIIQELMATPQLRDYYSGMEKFISMNMTAAEQFTDSMNWTELYENWLSLSVMMGQMDFSKTEMFTIPGLNQTEVLGIFANMSMLLGNFNTSTIASLYQSMDALQPLLQSMAEADPEFNGIYQSMHISLVSASAYQKFLNIQLKRLINANLSITELFPSEELQKVLEAQSFSPEVVEILMKSVISMVADPSKMIHPIESYTKICEDSDIFAKFFPVSPGSSTDPVKLQGALCNSLTVNWTIVGNELIENTEGLAEYIDVLKRTLIWGGLKDYPFNLSVTVKQYVTYSELMTLIATNPPNISWHDLTLSMEGVDWNSMFGTFVSKITEATKQYGNRANGVPQGLIMWIPVLQEILKTNLDSNFNYDTLAVHAALVTSTAFQKVVNIQLTKMLNANLSLTELFPSEELQKVLDAQSISPDMVEILMNSMVSMVVDPSKVTTMLDSFVEMCTDSDVFAKLFPVPPGSSTDPAKLQGVLCNSLTVNWTIVGNELIENMEGLAEYLDVFEKSFHLAGLVDYPMNLTNTIQQYITCINLVNALRANPPNFSWKNQTVSMEGVDWNAMVMTFVNKLTAATQQYSNGNLAQMVPLIQSMLMDNNTISSDMYGILNTVASVMEGLTFLKDPSMLFSGLPHLEKLMQWQSDIPDIVATLVLSSTNQAKFAPLNAAMTANVTLVCTMDIKQFLTVPPNVSVDFEDLKNTMCSMDAIESELMEFIARYQSPDTEMNVTSTLQRLLRAQEKLTAILSGNLTQQLDMFPWLQTSAWDAAFAQIMPLLPQFTQGNSLQGLDMYFAMIQQMSAYGLFNSDQMNSLSHLSIAIMETAIDFMNRTAGRTLQFTELLPNSPELTKLLELSLQMPSIFSILVTSSETSQFQKLLAYNFTTAFMELCDPRHDIEDYLSVPNASDIDLAYFKTQFCDIDFLTLESEIYTSEDLNIGYILEESKNTAAVNWTEFAQMQQLFVVNLMSYLEKPLVLLPVGPLYNGTEWIETLKLLQKSNSGDIASQVLGGYKSMVTALPEGGSRSVVAVTAMMHSVMKSVITYMEKLPKGNITLADLVGNNTLLLNYLLLSYSGPVELAEGILHATIHKPDVLLKFLVDVAKSGNPIEFYCNHTAAEIADMFQFPPEINIDSTYDLECRVNLTAIGNEAMGLLGIKKIIGKLQTALGSGDLSSFTLNETALAMDTQTLIMELQRVMADTKNFGGFKMNYETVTSLFNELMAKYSSTDLTQSIMELYGTLMNAISKSTGGKYSFGEYFAVEKLVLNYVTDLLKKVEVKDNTIQVSSLLGDVSQLSSLLGTSMNFSSDFSTVLSNTKVDMQKLGELFSLDEAGLVMLLCSPTQLEKYFTFPADVDINQLSEVLCRINTTQLKQELTDVFKFDLLAEKLMKAWQTPSSLDIEGIQDSYNKLVMEVMRFINVTEADLFGTTFSELISSRHNFTMTWGALTGISEADPSQYSSYLSTLEMLDRTLNGTEQWRHAKASMLGAQMFMEMMTGKIKQWPLAGLTIRDVLVNASYTSDYIQRTFAVAPEVVQALISAKIDWSQLMGTPDPGYLCSDDVVYAPGVDVGVVKTAVCEMNFTHLVLELQDAWDWAMIRDKFTEAAMDANYKMNWTAYMTSITNLQTTMTQYFESANFTDVASFFGYDGDFNAWLMRLQAAFSFQPAQEHNSTTALIDSSLKSFLTGLNSMMSGMNGQSYAAPLINTATEITKTIRKWLNTMFQGGTFSLSNILGESSEAKTLLESALNLHPEVVQALLNSQMSQDLYWMIMGNMDDVTKLLCNETVLAEHLKLSANATVSFNTLQQALCGVNVTVLLHQLQQVWDVSALMEQFAKFSDMTSGPNSTDAEANTAKLIAEWQKLIEQAGEMFQKPITIDETLLKSFNISGMFQKMMTQNAMAMILPSIKSTLMSTITPLPDNMRNQAGTWLKVINDQYSIVTDTGLTFQELMYNITAFSTVMTELYSYTLKQFEGFTMGNASAVNWSKEIDEAFDHYQILWDRGYYSFKIDDPEKLLALLQQTELSMFGLKQLEKSYGDADWYKQMMNNVNIVNGVVKYFNSLMEKAKEGGTMALEKLVPDVKSLRKLLSRALDPDSADLFLLMGIKPSVFMNSLGQSEFTEMVCDPVKFREMFDTSLLSMYNATDLQQKSCAAARNGTLLVKQIIDLMDIQLIYKQIMSGQSNSTGSWTDYISQMETLIKNLNYLMKMPSNDSAGLMDWLSKLSRLGTDLGLDANKTTQSFVAPCNRAVDWLEGLYPGEVTSSLLMAKFYMETSLLTTESVGELEGLVCTLPSANLTQLAAFWKKSKMAELTQKYIDVYGGKYHNASFSCGDYISVTNEYIAQYSKAQETWTKSWHGMSKCLSDVDNKNIPVLTQFSSMFAMLQEGYQLIKTSPDLANLLPKEVIPQMDNILRALLEQKPMLMKLEKLWSNTSDVTGRLSDLLKLSPYLVRQILASSIDLNKVMLINMTNSTLADFICNPEALDNMLSLVPGLPINASMISQLMCGPNLNNTLSFFSDNVNLGNMLVELYNRAPEYKFSMTWLTEFAESFNKLITDMQSAFKLTELMSSFDTVNLMELLGTIQTFLDENSPQRIFDDIDDILNRLELLMPPGAGGDNIIIAELRKMATGIRSLNILSKLPFDAPIHSLIKDPQALRTYMIQTLNISAEVADSFLNSSILYQKLADVGSLDFKSIVCTPAKLSTLLTFDKHVNVSRVSHQLCGLTDDEIAEMFDYIVQNLEIGEFIRAFVNIRPETVLENAGVTKEEVAKIAENFKPFQGNFQGLVNAFSNLTKEVDLDEINNALAGGTEGAVGSAAMTVLGDVLCGREKAFGVEDSYRIADRANNENNPSRRRRKRATATQELSDYDKRQMEELGNDTAPFCKDLYLSIKDTENGHIIWTYMKPLIRGKILYSPMTQETQALMMEATKVLRDIVGLKDILTTLSTSLRKMTDLGNFTDYSLLQKTLQNPFVAGAITETLGFAAEDLVGDLGSLTGMSRDDIDKTISMAELAYNLIACMEGHRLWSYESEEELTVDATILSRTNNILAGVVFMNMDEDGSSGRKKRQTTSRDLPKHIKYKIRMDIENVPEPDTRDDSTYKPTPEDDFAMDLRYLRGFIELQDMIDGAIIKQQTGLNDSRPAIQIRQFPYPCHNVDDFQTYSSTYFLPIIMFLAWLVAIASAIHSNVYDREKRLEETMKIMGLRSGVNWAGWFLNVFIGMLFMSFIIVLILKLGKLMPNSNPILIWVFLADFSFAMTMFCYMVSSFFTRTTLASLSGVICYLISYLPFIVIVALSALLKFWHNVLLCLSAATAFSFGSQLMTRRELEGPGIQWSNANIKNWGFSFDWCCYMMLIDAFIYAIIGWYVRNVHPGKYGVAQPWYFCVLPRYWCSCCRKTSSESRYIVKENGKHGTDESPGFGEPDPVNLPVGISMHGLSKSFKKRGKKHIAVDNLTANFYRGQVTAFLGENGAGKTTTINMLTGYIRSTSGRAFIEGRDISKDVTQIRQDLGICPQQDILFDYLTVLEHLDMFVHLKGKGNRKAKKEEKHKMLEMAGLQSCMHTRVSKLSGGQRRRLSVVLAFIGGSRVIILDEPTSGVDPCARRAIWDLIIQNREGRTILLCTHHLDEADILGDRVVMMHQGKMICSGSPLFLKAHYGSGYHLTINKEQNTISKMNQDKELNIPRTSASATEMLKFIQQHVQDAYISEEIGMEVTVVLPIDKGQLSKFHQLFAHIDSNLEALHISSYGISDTSLEEVFLKLMQQANRNEPLDERTLKGLTLKGPNGSRYDRDSGMIEGTSTLSKPSPSGSMQTDTMTFSSEGDSIGTLMTKKPVNSGLQAYRFGALFMKRLHHHRRDIRSYFSQIILPIVFMCVAMGCTLVAPKTSDYKALLLTPTIYPDTTMFFRTEKSSAWNSKYVDTLLHEPGIATTCMADSDKISKCKNAFDPTFHTPPVKDPSIYVNPEPCTCSDGFEVCPKGAGGAPMPRMTTQSGSYLHNITASQFNTRDYLLRTHKDYIHRRYGGWSFDVASNGSDESTVWWNNKGWHALPSFYNALSNMVLRAGVQSDSSQYGISTYNHPLPLNKRQLSEQLLMQGVAETGIALCILCAFCFVPAGYSIFLIHERVTKEKRLQFVYGVGLGLYWLTAFVWDMLAFLFTVGLAVAVAAAFQIPTYTARLNLAGFAVSLILFGWAAIPFVYLMTRRFKSPATGYMMTFIVNLIIGVTTTACTFLLSIFLYIDNVRKAYNILSRVFLIFPQFCLGDSLIRLSRNQFLTDINGMFNKDTYVSPFTFEMLLWHFVAMAIEGFVFMVLHLILESRPCQKSKNTELAKAAVQSGLDSLLRNYHSLNRKKMDPSYKEDEDVSLERQRVMTGEARDDLLVLYNLKKQFKKGRQNVTAVDNLTLGVPRGECFGLLGVNGAGKTTTFNMMTGEVVPTAGAALMERKVISENIPDMHRRVGYCPQDDALDPNLSVREMLICYGKLKGLHSDGIDKVVKDVIDVMGLTKYTKMTVKSLSGGSKRKLSTAIALLGDPDLLLMDEPTSGMDPQTRRLVWNMIISIIKDNRSVVFTSHSMEECEAICTRLSIMVNGRFMCLGSRQHIQQKYGRGYTVMIKAHAHVRDLAPIVDYMHNAFTGAILKDHHLNMLEFEIPHHTARLSDIFGSLESARTQLDIQDYSVSQTSLDKVFIGFARHQHDGTEEGEDAERALNRDRDDPLGYTNPAYDTWEQRPAAAGNILPHITLAHDPTQRGDEHTPTEINPDQPESPVARVKSADPELSSVIVVGDPYGDMGQTSYTHL